MDKNFIIKMVLQLYEVEKLSERQIAEKLNIGRRRVHRILHESCNAKAIPKKCLGDEYIHLIAHWYKEHPRLTAQQIYDRLIPYGYQGSYPTVVRISRQYRNKKQKSYHHLKFVPGEEAQIDWFFFNHPKIGQVAGFLYVLSYSRYAWGEFYQKTSLEFFLAGHLACFEHIGGLARSHRYDNVKTVVISRTPSVQYNSQFLDFSRFYGFSIYLCNPYKGNEKGRVERVIRDIRVFLYGENFIDLNDLNRKFHAWLIKRNNTIHRSTNKTPKDLLSEERLIALPQNAYLPRRITQAVASKTALVEFDRNKYSVPGSCTGKAVEVIAYPEKVEIHVSGKKVAIHKRSFNRKQIIQNPLHAEKLLKISPQFKMKRILQLINDMDDSFKTFIFFQEDIRQHQYVAHQIFQLLKTHSKAMLTSAVRELISMKCFKIKALRSLLSLPEVKDGDPLWPQNIKLLDLTYEERNLKDYDPDTRNMEST